MMYDTTKLLPKSGSFVSGIISPIFAPEDFNSDEQLMIATAELFSRESVLPRYAELDQQQEGLMPQLIHEAGAIGLCGVDSPEEYGGLGQSKNVAARILEFLSLDPSFSVTYGITSGISQVGLSLFGSELQKSKYLPKLASGDWMGAYALSEPNAGSDALSLTTHADFKGETYVLNGTKMWISNAKWADIFLVMAKVEGERLSAFLVERTTPGLTVAREEHKMGLKGSSTARLVFENAVIPAENLLYEEGKGHHVALNALNIGRFKLASMSIGPAREAMRLASRYCKERKQFGQTIGNFGLIRKKLADMTALFFATESAIYRTGHLVDEAFDSLGGTIEGNKRAAQHFAVECSLVKVLATEIEALIVDDALQCFGGYGFTEEFPIAHYYRDARVSRIYEGTNEINRTFLAERILKLNQESGAMAPESQLEEWCTDALTKSYQNQEELGALADLVIYTFAAQSARLRAQKTARFMTASQYFEDWALVKGAEAYRTLSKKSVTIPPPAVSGLQELADWLLENERPLA